MKKIAKAAFGSLVGGISGGVIGSVFTAGITGFAVSPLAWPVVAGVAGAVQAKAHGLSDTQVAAVGAGGVVYGACLLPLAPVVTPMTLAWAAVQVPMWTVGGAVVGGVLGYRD